MKNARMTICFMAAFLLTVGAVEAAVIEIETVPVGNAGNGPDTRYVTPGPGAVAYTYNIGKYEVTAGQYTAFLNAVAKTDTYGLYNPNMDTAVNSSGCNIKRNAGSSGSYSYSVASDWANRPVNFVSWGDSARFANWLHNGQPIIEGGGIPTGAQHANTTEDGAYYLNGAMSLEELMAVDRKSNAKWVIPSEDEWYKAAYYKGNLSTDVGYWDHATQSYNFPSLVLGYPTDPGNNATFHYYSDFTIGSPYWRTEVGAHENSESFYGTFDQAGNIAEWTEAKGGTTFRWLLGGSYLDTLIHAGDAGGDSPVRESEFTGIRVAEIPEPTSLLILVLGGLLIRKRK
jgi:formylglycine-generating enzyme required for sulfatase activity